MAQQLRVHNFSLSLDGYGAGLNQSTADPLGLRGEELHEWVVRTRSFRRQHNETTDEGETGIDDDFAVHGDEGIGATIMGRNMFGPIRGDWPNDQWKGWWGDNPPFHHPVFVLTHHPREPFTMEGGTSFHFVTDGIESALREAFNAASGQDVRLGGGVSTLQQYLRAGLVDYAHLAMAPVLLGAGERLFDGLAEIAAAYDWKLTASERAVHVEMRRR